MRGLGSRAFAFGLTLVFVIADGSIAAAAAPSPAPPSPPVAPPPPSTLGVPPSPLASPQPTLGLPPASAPPGVQPPPGPASGASPVPPTAESVPVLAPEAAAPLAAPEGDGPLARVVPTADAATAPSDHDAVVGAWGVEVRPVAATLPVFARRASTGCPIAPPGAPPVDCPPISVSTLGVRHWWGRNLAFNAGAALALGGGSDGGRQLDTYFGFGPTIGVSLLLGNWRHLTVAASPGLMVVLFKAAGSADTTYVADLRTDLEAELHLGFVGAPALSLGIRSGVLLRLEQAADVSVWSVGVAGATTPRTLLTDVLLRYYF